MNEEYEFNFEEQKEEENAENKIEITPNRGEEGWQDYVLSKLTEDELVEGYPKTDGLRRVAELTIGPIQECNIAISHYDATHRTAVACCFLKVHNLETDQMERYADVADCTPDNTPPEFAIHAAATAGTKAEGRALRKMMRLKNLITAEEGSNDVDVEEWSVNEPISDVHKVGIQNLCKKLKIDIYKFINMGRASYKSLDDVPKGIAVKMINKLNKYQRDDPIPNAILEN